jgi:hypothetical protein
MAEHKEIILRLIKDNLKNTLLVSGLNRLGLDAGTYHLNLTESIFGLIGFEEDDFEETVFEKYLILIEELVSKELLNDAERLKAVSTNIYESLIKERELQLLSKKQERV